MSRGDTTKINVVSFRADWNAGLPIAVLCVTYSVSRDQVVRLRDIWKLPLRHDRRKRHVARNADPTPEQIAARSLEVQEKWSDKVREDRHWKKVKPWRILEIELPENIDLDDLQG